MVTVVVKDFVVVAVDVKVDDCVVLESEVTVDVLVAVSVVELVTVDVIID